MPNADTSMNRREFLATAAAASAALAPLSALAAQRPKPGDWQIGMYTRPWDQWEYRVALDAIAQAGFKYAGLMTTKSKTHLVISAQTTPEEAQKVGEEVRKRGLVVPNVYGGGIPVGTSLEAGIAGLRRLIDSCVTAGAQSLMMGGIGDPKLYGRYYKAIAECCAYAEEKKLGLILKPHGGLNASGPQCRKSIELVGHRNFTLWYDPGNIFYYSDAKLDPVDDAATVDGLVTGMCIKDYKHPKDVMVMPGTGMVRFREVLARLRKGGFTGGPLVIETVERGDLPKLLKQAEAARKFVEELVKG